MLPVTFDPNSLPAMTLQALLEERQVARAHSCLCCSDDEPSHAVRRDRRPSILNVGIELLVLARVDLLACDALVLVAQTRCLPR